MKDLIILSILILSTFGKFHPEAKLYFTDYCTHFGYPSEKHYVTTEDGYILTFFRVQAKGTIIQNGLPPILLMHGLLDCSDTFIINDEDKAPAFVLANRGYDVWLANNRGNKHSQDHINLTTKDKEFWDFTFEEMAFYDLPAAFRYVNDKTNQQIIYIGHSEGTAQMHAHLATYQNSIVRKLMKLYIGLGPVAYVDHQDSTLVNLMLHSGLEKLLVDFGINEFMVGDTWFTSDAGRIFCGAFPLICGDIIGSIVSADKNLDNYERYDVLAGHEPAGTSTKNIIYWKQLVQSKKFQRYDYGKVLNNRIYGQSTPPEYDFKNINIPVYYIAGFEDLLADPEDVQRLVNSLTQSPKVWIKFYHAGHCSYMWGKEMPFFDDLFNILDGKL